MIICFPFFDQGPHDFLLVVVFGIFTEKEDEFANGIMEDNNSPFLRANKMI